MTRAEARARLDATRRAAADFRRRGLWRFAAEADRRAAELARAAG